MTREVREVDQLLRDAIKLLLIQLAAKSETPSQDLEAILHDVIQELHDETLQVLEEKKTSHLRLITDIEPEVASAVGVE